MSMTFRGLHDIPKTHNMSRFRTDTPSGSGWKTSFCSFSEGGSVTEIQFVTFPFAQNEKFKLIWHSTRYTQDNGLAGLTQVSRVLRQSEAR